VAWSTVVVANGFLFELALYALLAPEFHTVRGLATAILSLLYVVGARQAAGRSKSREAVRLTRLTGLGMAALAIPIQFDLQWVTLGWSLLALVLLDSGFSASALGERLLAYAVLLLAVLHAFLFDTVQAFADLDVYRPWVNGTFLVGAAAAGALGLAARALSRNRHVITPFERRLVTPLILMSAIVLLLRVLVEVVAGFELRERLTGAELYLPMLLTVTLVWTVYSGLLILGGFMFRYRPIRFLGIASLAFLLFKVFAFDLQELERGYRIASFAGVGLLLLLISILYQRERRTA
jgi:hypothetical protein